MNYNLQYLADCIIIEALAKDNSIKLAQDAGGSILGSVTGGIKEYVSSLYDSKRPIASITSFIAPGLLLSMGFKWIAVLYEVAEALGFDWKSFWSSLANSIKKFAKSIFGKDSSDPAVSSQINSAVQTSIQDSFSGGVDKNKLSEIAGGKFAHQMRNALEVKAFVLNPIVKSAGFFDIFRGKISTFFIKVISWLIKTALISAGFLVAGKAVSKLLGNFKPLKSNDDEVSQENNNQTQTNYRKTKLQLSSSAPRSFFIVHTNNNSSVWIENGDINDIESIVKSWVLAAFPNAQNIESSNVFNSIIDKFMDRNRLANGLGIFSVPRPYQRKIDIVSQIAASLSTNENDNTETDKSLPIDV